MHTATRPPDQAGAASVREAALAVVSAHGPALMSVAQRHSTCREDAEDAYQRAIEILLRRRRTEDVATLLPWLKTVVKHEAYAVRDQRLRHGEASEACELESLAGAGPGTAEVAERRDRLRTGAEALAALKSQELRALVLKAEGLSYREICHVTGWSYTKVNRCLAEGRRGLVAGLARIESGAECERLAPLLSRVADGEASAADVAAVRPHLSGCLACRGRLREYRGAPARAAALVPPLAAGSVWESVRHVAHALAMRWQEAGELVTAHKLAAVAASAAVVAGGGAATVSTLSPRGPVAAPQAAAHAARSAPVRLRRPTLAPAPRVAGRMSGRAGGGGSRRLPARRSRPPAGAVAEPGGEFAPGADAPASDRAPASRHTQPSDRGSPDDVPGGEFTP